MSATMIEHLESLIKDKKIKYVLHSSKTDDKLKNELEDVNSFWVQFQVVLYSPTIESGVDFNVPHFDKIYGIIRNGFLTCSQRAFLQMVGRIRTIKDHDILCYYDGPTQLDASIYTYDDLLSYFRYYEQLSGRRIIENVVYKKVERNGDIIMTRDKQDISLYDHISIYNEVEILNKNPTIFMTILNKLIQRGGHTLRFELINKTVRVKNEHDIADELADLDLTGFNIKELLTKQTSNQLDSEEKLALQKYFFMKTFSMKRSDNTRLFTLFYQQYKNKVITFKRFEKIFEYSDKSDSDDDELCDLHTVEEINRQLIIKDFVARLIGFNDNEPIKNPKGGIIIDYQQYVRGIIDIAKNSIYFKNETENRVLFFKTKGNILPLSPDNFDHYSKTITAILDTYGIVLERNERKRLNGQRFYNYSLSVDKQIKDLVDYKYNFIDTVPGYEELF
jgi:hypothetical protein